MPSTSSKAKPFRFATPIGRFYSTPDGIFPSITTILDATADKSALDGWRAWLGKEKAATVTQAAADRGTIIHQIAEFILRHPDDPVPEEFAAHHLTINRVRSIIDQYVNREVMMIEKILWSKSLRISGSCDLLAFHKKHHRLTVFDWKTTTQPKNETVILDYFLQTTGYAAMASERTGLSVDQVMVVAFNPLFFQKYEKPVSDYMPRLIERIEQFYTKMTPEHFAEIASIESEERNKLNMNCSR